MRYTDYDNEKLATGINIGPGAIIGALTGAAIGARKAMKPKSTFEQEYENIRSSHMPKQKQPIVEGSYYSQVNNIANNLRVVFTPVSAIYMISNGLKNIPIETINTDAMDDVMHEAWRRKDEPFFKNMILNKMLVEINFAEKMFAKDIIKNHKAVLDSVLKRNGKIQKQASEFSNDIEYMNKIAAIKESFDSMSPDARTYVTDALMRLSDSDDRIVEVSLGFDGDPEKYASLGNATDVFGINFAADRIRKLTKKLESPRYLKDNVSVGFLPDRVVFMVDNVVVSTFPIINMDREAFSAFKDHDVPYFHYAFAQEIKKGKNAMAKKAEEDESDGLEKKASNQLISAPKATMFRISGISPYVYYLTLCKKYTKKWNEIDSAALIKMIEVDFKIGEQGIADIPLNKILSISTCLSEETTNAFSNALAFEKIIRSFNDLPINFLISEKETITVNELVYGIHCYAEIMYDRGVDVYSLFSDEIKSYIADLLFDNDILVLYPNIGNSESAIDFYGDINSMVLRTLIEKNNLESDNMDSNEFKQATQNEILQPISVDILTEMRDNNISEELSSDRIAEIAKKCEFDMDKESLLRRQIKTNIDVDAYLARKAESEEAQLKLYNLI